MVSKCVCINSLYTAERSLKFPTNMFRNSTDASNSPAHTVWHPSLKHICWSVLFLQLLFVIIRLLLPARDWACYLPLSGMKLNIIVLLHPWAIHVIRNSHVYIEWNRHHGFETLVVVHGIVKKYRIATSSWYSCRSNRFKWWGPFAETSV